MKYIINNSELRVYSAEDSCVFKKNGDQYGQLSNMSTGFPIRVNDISIRTTEALYQACRFPMNTEFQERIIKEVSPMRVKMISNSLKVSSREDWDSVRVKIMKWCINIKYAQNILTFGEVLNSTGSKYIVENSTKDNFWGAIPDADKKSFKGKNALGRLLMDLRQKFQSKRHLDLLYIEPPEIDDFLLFNEKIRPIDERLNYIKSVAHYWDLNQNLLNRDSNNDKWFNLGLNLNSNQTDLF